MFVSHTATLDVSFEVAMTRLAALTGSGVLTQVSADAYAAGAPPSVPWLAGSRFRDLITRPSRAVLAVRWETDGHYGEPSPVLDADLTLTPAGPSAALLELSGIYRADSGEDGPRMGAVVLGGFMDRIAETITRAGYRHRLGPPWDPGPARAGSSALARSAR